MPSSSQFQLPLALYTDYRAYMSDVSPSEQSLIPQIDVDKAFKQLKDTLQDETLTRDQLLASLREKEFNYNRTHRNQFCAPYALTSFECLLFANRPDLIFQIMRFANQKNISIFEFFPKKNPRVGGQEYWAQWGALIILALHCHSHTLLEACLNPIDTDVNLGAISAFFPIPDSAFIICTSIKFALKTYADPSLLAQLVTHLINRSLGDGVAARVLFGETDYRFVSDSYIFSATNNHTIQILRLYLHALENTKSDKREVYQQFVETVAKNDLKKHVAELINSFSKEIKGVQFSSEENYLCLAKYLSYCDLISGETLLTDNQCIGLIKKLKEYKLLDGGAVSHFLSRYFARPAVVRAYLVECLSLGSNANINVLLHQFLLKPMHFGSRVTLDMLAAHYKESAASYILSLTDSAEKTQCYEAIFNNEDSALYYFFHVKRGFRDPSAQRGTLATLKSDYQKIMRFNWSLIDESISLDDLSRYLQDEIDAISHRISPFAFSTESKQKKVRLQDQQKALRIVLSHVNDEKSDSQLELALEKNNWYKSVLSSERQSEEDAQILRLIKKGGVFLLNSSRDATLPVSSPKSFIPFLTTVIHEVQSDLTPAIAGIISYGQTYPETLCDTVKILELFSILLNEMNHYQPALLNTLLSLADDSLLCHNTAYFKKDGAAEILHLFDQVKGKLIYHFLADVASDKAHHDLIEQLAQRYKYDVLHYIQTLAPDERVACYQKIFTINDSASNIFHEFFSVQRGVTKPSVKKGALGILHKDYIQLMIDKGEVVSGIPYPSHLLESLLSRIDKKMSLLNTVIAQSGRYTTGGISEEHKQLKMLGILKSFHLRTLPSESSKCSLHELFNQAALADYNNYSMIKEFYDEITGSVSENESVQGVVVPEMQDSLDIAVTAAHKQREEETIPADAHRQPALKQKYGQSVVALKALHKSNVGRITAFLENTNLSTLTEPQKCMLNQLLKEADVLPDLIDEISQALLRDTQSFLFSEERLSDAKARCETVANNIAVLALDVGVVVSHAQIGSTLFAQRRTEAPDVSESTDALSACQAC